MRMPGAILHLLSIVLLWAVTCFVDARASSHDPHWSLVAPDESDLAESTSTSWPVNAIDLYILNRLEQENLLPSPEAPRATLIRRLNLDLIGLPPSLSEVQTFLSDESPNAYEVLVDRILASPHFGEKWARWWLDLAAYADSDGYLSDFLRPNAWIYRDWVVGAFNANMPFDQFTIEQLAGDLLPDATVSQRTATGFLRNTLSNREGGADLEEFRVRQVVARTSAVGTVWLGLTLGCAECHDHKFDPISQKEFYSLFAFFNSADEINVNAPTEEQSRLYQAARPAYEEKRKTILSPIERELAALQAEWERQMLEAVDNPDTADHRWLRTWEVLGLVWGQNFGEGQHEGTVIVRTPSDRRTREESERLQDYFLANGSIVNESKWAELKLSEISRQIDELNATLPKWNRAPAMAQAREPRPTFIHRRGDFRSRGDEVTPDTPAVLPPLNPHDIPTRLDLARWLVRRDNPLTARVIVNQFWQELFGRGLVATSDDFGTRGAKPSHPDLLDRLAIDFMEDGWNVKNLMKRIVMSATYRQSSDRRPELNNTDPGNVLLARQSRLRLHAESIRDSALYAGGLLNTVLGGPSVRPPQPDSVSMEGFMNTWTPSEGEDRYRRSLYTFLQRTSPFGSYVTFDLPDVNRPCTRRERSNTPLQALNLLNDPSYVEAAGGLARRIESFALQRVRQTGSVSVDDCIDHAFQLALARPASPNERARLARYLDEQAALFARDPKTAPQLVSDRRDPSSAVEPAAWTALCSVILNLDEFITRE
ncbi:MAG: hypothetical protein AMXMBFR84_14160 [Candidatus Hydrogenedentota bacterium]